MLHAIKECPKSTQLTYIVKKGWPFLPVFNDVIQRFTEAGLLFKWYEQVEQAIVLNERIHRRSVDDKLRVFSLLDVQTAFYMLGIGLAVCCSILLVEISIEYRAARPRAFNFIRSRFNHLQSATCATIRK